MNIIELKQTKWNEKSKSNENYFLRAACLLSCGGRAVGNVRVVINASELLCEVKIVDFSIVIRLHQLLKFIKPEEYMESMH